MLTQNGLAMGVNMIGSAFSRSSFLARASAIVVVLGIAIMGFIWARSTFAGPTCETEWASATSGEWKEASNWTAGVPSGSTKACITKVGSYTVTVTGTREVGSLTISGGANGPMLALSASIANGDAVLVAHGELINGATIALTDTDLIGGNRARVEMESGATLTNEGTIVSEPGLGGAGERVLNGKITNTSSGAIDVIKTLAIDSGSPATFATSGAVKVESGQTLFVDHSGSPGTWVIEGGKVENRGTIYDHTPGPGPNGDGGHATLEAKGGALTGNPVLADSVTANLSGTGSGTFELAGAANNLAGSKIASGYTLVLYALDENGFDDGVASDAANITNEGTIKLTNESGEISFSRDARIEMESGAMLTNEGTIVAEPGPHAQGTRTINGNFTNASSGKLEVKQSMYVDRGSAATFATSGTVKVEPSQTLFVDHSGSPGTWVIEGGTIEDKGTIYDHTAGPGPNGDGGHGALEAKGGTLTGTPVLADSVTANLSGSGKGTFELAGAANNLAGSTIGSGYTLVMYALEANGFNDAVAAAGENLTNDGTIRLTNESNEGSRDARIEMASGKTLTNEGAIVAEPGPKGVGTRTLDGGLTNGEQGTIEAKQSLQIDRSEAATFATRGTVKVTSGQTLLVDLSNTPGTFAIEGGTIENNGTIYDHTIGPENNGAGGHGTLEAKAGTLTGNPVLAVSVTADLSGTGSGTFELAGGANNLSGAKIGSGYTLVMYALEANGFDDGIATDSSNITNDGTIELTDESASGGRRARLEMESSAVLTNEGTIVSEPGAHSLGERELNGNVTNGASGKIEVKQSLLIDRGGVPSTFKTSGTVKVGTGQTLYVDHTNTPGTWAIEGGTIENSGTIYDHTPGPGPNGDGGVATLEAKSGALSGNGVTAVNVNANLSGTGSGVFTLAAGNNTLTGDIGAGYTLALEALSENGFGDAVVSAASAFNNNGTIDLTNQDIAGSGQRDSRLVLSGGTLTNHGKIVAEPGLAGQGTRTIQGNLANAADGTIEVNTGMYIDSGPAAAFTTSGKVKVQTGQTLFVDHTGTPGTWKIEGGTIENSGTIYDHTTGPGPNNDGGVAGLEALGGALSGNGVTAVNVNANLSGTGSGIFTLAAGANTLSGDIGAGYTLALEGLSQNGFGDAVVSAASAFNNNGTIDLTNQDKAGEGPRDSRLALSSGTLTNNGKILSDTGREGQGTRTIEGAVANGSGGTIEVKQGLRIGAGGTLTTAGTVNVAAGTTLKVAGPYTQSAGSTQLEGAGATLAPGGAGSSIEGGALSGAGTIEGNVLNAGRVTVASSSPGVLNVTGNYEQSSIGVLAAGVTHTGADRLNVSGTSTLGGTLSVTTASGFTPALGEKYELLKSVGARSGEFAHANGLPSGPYSVSYTTGAVTLTAIAASEFPSFSINSPTVVRGSGDVQLTFTVTLSQSVHGGASAEYATADGTAHAPGDYEQTHGTLTFNTGETSKTVTVTVHGVSGPGADKVLYVDLENAQNALINQERGTGTIVNDDMTLSSVTPSHVGDHGQVTIQFIGSGFTHQQTVQLTREGQAAITPVKSTINAEGTSISATFNFEGAADGAWTPVVTIPEGPSVSLPGGLTIEPVSKPEPGGKPQPGKPAPGPASVSAELLGAHWTAGNYPWTGILQYTNSSNVDATNAVLEIDGFNVGGDVSVTAPAGSNTRFSVLSRRTATDSGVDIGLPLVPARSTSDLLVTFTAVGPETDVYHLRVATLVSSAPTPATDPRTTVSGELLSQNLASFNAILHVASPSASGDLHVGFSAVSPFQPGALQYTTAQEAGGLTHDQLIGEVPPPATHAPAASATTPIAAFAAENSENKYTVQQGARDTLIVIGGNNVISTGQAINGASETYTAYTEQEREIQINGCLLKLNLITKQQAEEAQRLAEANTFAQSINTMASYIPGLGSIATKELNALTAVSNTAWSNYMFGNKALGGLGAIEQSGGPFAGQFAGMSPAEQFAVVTRQICPEMEPPNRGKELTPESFKKAVERTPGTQAFELALRVPGDPNEITGPAGYGKRRYIATRQPLSYQISFENKPTATASASEVKITDRLDPRKVNLATLTLGSVYIGEHAIAAPPGVSAWTGTMDMRPTANVLVRVTAGLNKSTGVLSWDLLAIDPASGQPAPALDGFLPPNTQSPNGQGGVTFTVMPNSRLRTGAAIKGLASIVFNRNAAIATPTWTNTIDTSIPSSRVARVRRSGKRSCPAVKVSWSGRDRGAPIAYYQEYVSRDRHRYTLWQTTNHASAAFRPAAGKHSYRFQSVAVNGVGHRQKRPSRGTPAITINCH